VPDALESGLRGRVSPGAGPPDPEPFTGDELILAQQVATPRQTRCAAGGYTKASSCRRIASGPYGREGGSGKQETLTSPRGLVRTTHRDVEDQGRRSEGY
jgi:hypothetical protein